MPEAANDSICRICVQVLQSMTDEQRAALTPIKLRRKARDFAMKAVKSQRDQFKRCATCCRLAAMSPPDS